MVNDQIKKLMIVWGISGSGKTTFTKDYAKKHQGVYIDFDSIFNYKEKDDNKFIDFINKLSNLIKSSNKKLFVIDGYSGYDTPSIFYLKNKLGIDIQLCLCFAAPHIIYQRQKDKVKKKAFDNFSSKEEIKEQTEDLFFLIDSIDKNALFVDTTNGFEFINKKDWTQRWRDLLFISELSEKDYDQYYQDINLPSALDIKGYSESEKTWEKLSNLIDFKDQKVLDIGCFHGFFSFKIEQAGAKEIDSVEKSNEAILTARKLSWLKKSKVCFYRSDIVDFKTQNHYDIVLVLNMLHHVSDIPKALKNVFSIGNLIVFEIPVEQEKMVSKYAKDFGFKSDKRINSHRETREIILFKNSKSKTNISENIPDKYQFSYKKYKIQKIIKDIKVFLKRYLPNFFLKKYHMIIKRIN